MYLKLVSCEVECVFVQETPDSGGEGGGHKVFPFLLGEASIIQLALYVRQEEAMLWMMLTFQKAED